MKVIINIIRLPFGLIGGIFLTLGWLMSGDDYHILTDIWEDRLWPDLD